MREPPDNALLAAARQNQLLNALPEPALESILADMTLTNLQSGRNLYREDSTVKALYFPLQAVIAILERDRKAQAIVATVGNEGAVGISITMGIPRPLGNKIVQKTGQAITIQASRFQELLRNKTEVAIIMHRYVYAFLRGLLQTGACSRLHNTNERCARYLLLAHDRAGRMQFPLTQAAVAANLAIPRRKVNRTFHSLRTQGAIDYVYRNITITNRTRLEDIACPCYQIIRDAHNLVKI